MLERDVAPGIHRIEDAYTNWYLVEGDGALTIVPVPGSPRVVFTPGHTLGPLRAALSRPQRGDRRRRGGDARPLHGRDRPEDRGRGSPADSKRALESLDALADTGATTVLTGHGEAWRGGTVEAVARARRAGAS
jgi:glyoxylase-like metal-dependent hydrolase (beta-lactamase superfamily II)